MKTDPLAVVNGVDVDAVTKSVLGCRSVMGLGAEIATYHHGRRIDGVRIQGNGVQLHVLGRYDVTVEALCAEISAAVSPLLPGKDIDISVVDMVDPYLFDTLD